MLDGNLVLKSNCTIGATGGIAPLAPCASGCNFGVALTCTRHRVKIWKGLTSAIESCSLQSVADKKRTLSSTCNYGRDACMVLFIHPRAGHGCTNRCTSHSPLSKDKHKPQVQFSSTQPHLAQPQWRWPKVPLRLKAMRGDRSSAEIIF